MESFKREPVAIINAGVGLGEAILILFGIWFDLGPEIMTAATTVIFASGFFVKTFFARKQVTPIADPRLDKNTRLIPEKR